jgi:acetaldehyde dehydrogenase (acetylating)
MDADLASIQQARDLLRAARAAQLTARELDQEAVDRIVDAMVRAGVKAADRLARLACEETGFGRPDSKKLKNLFATERLGERLRGMQTVGIVARTEDGSVWEVATPMGVVAALIPSTNPTSTAMYKAIIAAKARCGIVMSPHPRARACTAEALRVVAEAAVRAGAPEGLFGCMSEITAAGTEALLADPQTDLILATGGTAMVRAAYSKGKPAYGVGSGNVPVYVDRSADLAKAAADVVYGASFDWGTLCSAERSLVVDLPVRARFLDALRSAGAHVTDEAESDLLARLVVKGGRLNTEQIGKPPFEIARMAGFSVPRDTRVLVVPAASVGPEEPLSMETLSPILTLYTADGWEAGCERCMEVLAYGGMGHTLGLHATSERVIEAFALQKPAMRIVVNSVAALGSIGYTTSLFPAMTLGPGTLGGSITSDNISPMHLVNIKRVAFETRPVTGPARISPGRRPARPDPGPKADWIATVEARLRERAGNPTSPASPAKAAPQAAAADPPAASPAEPAHVEPALSDEEIESLVARFTRRPGTGSN